MLDRVTETLSAVDVGGGGAGHVEDSDPGALVGAFGQVGATWAEVSGSAVTSRVVRQRSQARLACV